LTTLRNNALKRRYSSGSFALGLSSALSFDAGSLRVTLPPSRSEYVAVTARGLTVTVAKFARVVAKDRGADRTTGVLAVNDRLIR